MAHETGRLRLLYLLLAYLFLALALIGVALPGIPTVPFLLLAAWAADRGSPRLHGWLCRHRHFGPLLRHWRERRAVPLRAKWSAVLLLGLSWVVMNWHAEGPWLPLATGVLFLAIAAFVVTRPTARPTCEALD